MQNYRLELKIKFIVDAYQKENKIKCNAEDAYFLRHGSK